MMTRDAAGGGAPAQRPIERLRGMDDLLPATARSARRALDALSAVAESFGYQAVDAPIVEPTELFLRKSGEALAPKLYAFTYLGRDICVRPEFTASVGRLFVERLQDAPAPQRLYYSGPVLRHEKPQRGRRRQFTQMGLELIGAGGPLADAEIILAACAGLDALGLRDYRVTLGHLGAIAEMLTHLKLDRRARNFLLTNLENLSRPERGPAFVEARLTEQYPPRQDSAGLLSRLTSGAERDEARVVLQALLERLDADTALGSRPADEIIESVLDHLSRPDQHPLIRQALTLTEELAAQAGPPSRALPAAAALLARESLSDEPLRELSRTVALLREAGVPDERLTVNLGFGRGLHYYTGMIFEVYPAGPEESEQPWCGGGRYDDLITAMGGRRRTPACGFAYNLGRLLDALPANGPAPAAEILLCATDAELHGGLLRLAAALRRAGRRVETDVRGRTERANAQYAARCGIPFVVTVLAAERYQLRRREDGSSAELDEPALLRWAAGRREEGGTER
jgi:histidyl-tRNA synthetase